jgi:hypothetical protein
MDWSEIIIAAVGLVISAVVLPLVKVAFAWLKSRTENEAVQTALDEARVVANNVVASLKSTLVDGLKAKSADGKLSATEALEIAQKATGMFLSDLSQRSLEVLGRNADDLAAYVGNLLEARLLALKEGR